MEWLQIQMVNEFATGVCQCNFETPYTWISNQTSALMMCEYNEVSKEREKERNTKFLTIKASKVAPHASMIEEKQETE